MGNTYSNTASQHNRFDIKTLNAKELFNLPDNYTWDELKNRYKQLALKAHPDKGGDREAFNYITQCFQKLSTELRLKEHDKQHHELKHQFDKEQSEYRYSTNHVTIKQDDNEPFLNRFNRFFEENRFEDDEDRGYGDMMVKSTKNREEIEIPNLFGSTDVNPNRFNETFENKVPVKKEVVKYKEPEPMPLKTGISYSLLGTKTNDFTGETENKNLAYTDYIRAYTEQRTPTDITRKEFKSVKEYQRYREKNMNNPITQKEKKRLEEKKIAEEKAEQERLIHLKQKDQAIENYYAKISKLNIAL
eukprot:762478-Hanusia_phi.AAC.13